MNEQVSVSKDVTASADKVWAMVSDVTRMGEWSPENQGGTWLKGASGPVPGAKFKGRNKIGKRKWSTVATVIDADPGRRFSFRVAAGPMGVADWAYSFESTPSGCTVTETWTDRRNGFFKVIAGFITGVKDRASHNRIGMEQTLAALAAVAESAG